MVEQMTIMERIANTPIPKSCKCDQQLNRRFSLMKRAIDGIHLKQCVTLYVFALPFTLVQDLGWSMIGVVTIVAFTLMGIEGIADEIEMPFGKHPV